MCVHHSDHFSFSQLLSDTDEGRSKEDRMEGQGTMKMSRNVIISKPNNDKEDGKNKDGDTEMTEAEEKEKRNHDWMIPLQFQSDISHIHMRAGFTQIGL